MDISTIMIISGALGGVIAISQIIGNSDKKKKLLNEFENIQNFTPSQKFISKDLVTAIAIDESTQKICFLSYSQNNINKKIINYNDILSSELFIDNDTITKTSRMSQAGGTLVGAALLGGVGAVIGGLSGTKTSSDMVKRIDLRLVINDMANPTYDINFLNIQTKKNSLIYNDSLNKARHWSGIIDIVIRNSEKMEVV